jgi:hypothetical protein
MTKQLYDIDSLHETFLEHAKKYELMPVGDGEGFNLGRALAMICQEIILLKKRLDT